MQLPAVSNESFAAINNLEFKRFIATIAPLSTGYRDRSWSRPTTRTAPPSRNGWVSRMSVLPTDYPEALLEPYLSFVWGKRRAALLLVCAATT